MGTSMDEEYVIFTCASQSRNNATKKKIREGRKYHIGKVNGVK